MMAFDSPALRKGGSGIYWLLTHHLLVVLVVLVSLLVPGHWSLVLVTGYWLLVSGYWLTVTGYWLLVTSYWSLVTLLLWYFQNMGLYGPMPTRVTHLHMRHF